MRRKKVTLAWNGEDVAQATASLFEQKGLRLDKQVASNLPEITGDRDRLIQVVINLISNAVKFTDSGTITCRAERRGGDEGREVALEAGGGPQVPLPADQRVDLADPADVLFLDQHPAGAARVEERLLAGNDLDRDAELASERRHLADVAPELRRIDIDRSDDRERLAHSELRDDSTPDGPEPDDDDTHDRGVLVFEGAG